MAERKKAAACLLLLDALDEDESWKTGSKTRAWIRRRGSLGIFNLIQELGIEDTHGYREMMRMNKEQFKEILQLIEPHISKQTNNFGKPISPAERLALTVRYLATGDTFRSLHFQFRISRAAISYIIKEVCSTMHKVLAPNFLSLPQSESDWRSVATDFEEKWNFPNCIGAIDGKHVIMKCPSNAGSRFFNYKKTYSIVLLAVCGPDYEVIYADVGANGRVSDGGIWNKCSLLSGMSDGSICLPEPKCLMQGIKPVPHVFVADDAFALKPFLMKPYPQRGLNIDQRVFNYRLSRARRISENTFGILANRWRVYYSAMQVGPTAAKSIVLATLSLHNYLRKSQSRTAYSPVGLMDKIAPDGTIVPGNWRDERQSNYLRNFSVTRSGNNASLEAKEIRETFKEYFFNEGAVPWQWNSCMDVV